MITTIGQLLIILSGIWLITVSAVMFIKPKIASYYFKKAASTNFINYSEIIIRCIWGISLLLYAGLSKYSEFFKIFGLVIIGTSLILFFIPRKWHARYAVWSVTFIEPYMRVASLFSFVLGIFLIYAVI